MIENFELQTEELNEKELGMIPVIIEYLESQKESVKAPKIVKDVNLLLLNGGYNTMLSERRLRKCTNEIRTRGIAPLIATSDGYYITKDKQVIESQIKSLMQRACSIRLCAEGLTKFI